MATIKWDRIVALKRFVPAPPARRRLAAASFSIALHAGLVLFLLWQPHTTGIRGDSGRHYGAGGPSEGFDPVFAELISAQAAASRNMTATKQSPPLPDVTPDLQAADGSQGETPGMAVQTAKSGGAAPGTADGEHSLLEQIARCLPPGERPGLTAASLSLSLDGAGHLTAAPRLNVDLAQLTPVQLRSANQVVQAAMQCGPYAVAPGQVAMIDLVPDFRAIPLNGQ